MIVKPSINHTVTKRVSLLCRHAKPDAGSILQELETQGYEVFKCTIHDSPPPGLDIIAL